MNFFPFFLLLLGLIRQFWSSAVVVMESRIRRNLPHSFRSLSSLPLRLIGGCVRIVIDIDIEPTVQQTKLAKRTNLPTGIYTFMHIVYV